MAISAGTFHGTLKSWSQRETVAGTTRDTAASGANANYFEADMCEWVVTTDSVTNPFVSNTFTILPAVKVPVGMRAVIDSLVIYNTGPAASVVAGSTLNIADTGGNVLATVAYSALGTNAAIPLPANSLPSGVVDNGYIQLGTSPAGPTNTGYGIAITNVNVVLNATLRVTAKGYYSL